MSQATNRLHQAFDLLKVALAEVTEASHALPDDEYTLDLPTVLVCSYEPLQQKGTFTLLGTVEHAAHAFEEAFSDPENYPFRRSVAQAMGRRMANRQQN
jgi:hypothetical protein